MELPIPTTAEIAACANLFDVAALLYLGCETFHDSTPFSQLQVAMNDHRDYANLIAFAKKATKDWPSDGRQAQKILDAESCWAPADLADVYQRIAEETERLGCPPRFAVWLLLKEIDSLLGRNQLAFQVVSARKDALKPEPLNKSTVKRAQVHVKLPSTCQWQPALGAEAKITLAAGDSLEYLAILPPDLPLEFRMSRKVWPWLNRSMPLVIAAISPPVAQDDFSIKYQPGASGIADVFWIKAQESDLYRDNIIALLHQADNAGATIAVLPELSTSETIERMVASVVFNHLRLIVCGSYHVPGGASGRYFNESPVLSGVGMGRLWTHDKRKPFSPREADNPDAPFPFKCIEYIDASQPQTIMQTQIGAIAVLICLDFLQPNELHWLCRGGCRWFFVPAYTPQLGGKPIKEATQHKSEGKFYEDARRYGQEGKAATVVANNRHITFDADFQSSGKEHEGTLFYAPIRGGSTLRELHTELPVYLDTGGRVVREATDRLMSDCLVLLDLRSQQCEEE